MIPHSSKRDPLDKEIDENINQLVTVTVCSPWVVGTHVEFWARVATKGELRLMTYIDKEKKGQEFDAARGHYILRSDLFNIN